MENQKEKFKDNYKEVSKNKLLDLEIADYERSIKGLNVQLLHKDREIAEAKNELSIANDTINKLKLDAESLIKNNESTEEKYAKLNQILVKAKKDLTDAKISETQHLTNDAQMKSQLESYNVVIENYKVKLVLFITVFFTVFHLRQTNYFIQNASEQKYIFKHTKSL